MKNTTLLLLHINGWTAILIGSLMVIDPVSMLHSYGLQSDLSAGLLSELKAPGGLLIASGLMMIRYSISEALHERGLQTAIMVYGGYGSVRLLGIAVDGMPPFEILVATGIELFLCGVSLITFWKIQPKPHCRLCV